MRARPSPARPLRRSILLGSLVAASAIALAGAPGASATVTATKITSPADGAVIDKVLTVLDPSQGELTVQGTATLDGPVTADDQVVLLATGGDSGQPQTQTVGPVPVAPDGSFSFQIDQPMLNIVLQAVPATDVATAQRTTSAPAADDAFRSALVLAGIFAYAPPTESEHQQLTASRGQRDGWFIASVAGTSVDFGRTGGSIGGLVGGPNDARGLATRLTFIGTSAVWDEYNDTRGPVMVDGKHAYLNGQVEASDVSRTLDAAAGGQTIVERQPLIDAATAGPEGSGARVPVGVDLERTTVQDHDGAQATVTDVYRSSDGRAHRLDVLYSEGLGFPVDSRSDSCAQFCSAGALPGLAAAARTPVRAAAADPADDELAAFRIPWETGDQWQTKAEADPLSAPPSATSTIFTRVNQSLFGDDDAEMGYGAITFGTRPDGGLFMRSLFGGATSQFVARFVRDVPANGTTRIVQVYSNGETAAATDALAADAERRLTTPDPDPQPPVRPVPPLGPPTAVPPGAATRIRPVKLTLAATHRIRRTSGPRTFRFSGQLVLPTGADRRACAAGGTVSIQVSAGRSTISTRRVRLDATCRYAVRVTFRSARRFARQSRLSVKGRWAGNRSIAGTGAVSARVRVR